jgi:hypothetical protein
LIRRIMLISCSRSPVSSQFTSYISGASANTRCSHQFISRLWTFRYLSFRSWCQRFRSVSTRMGFIRRRYSRRWRALYIVSPRGMFKSSWRSTGSQCRGRMLANVSQSVVLYARNWLAVGSQRRGILFSLERHSFPLSNIIFLLVQYQSSLSEAAIASRGVVRLRNDSEQRSTQHTAHIPASQPFSMVINPATYLHLETQGPHFHLQANRSTMAYPEVQRL